MSIISKFGIVAGTAIALGACSSLPDRVDSLETARTAVRSVEQNELASEVAAAELASAREAIAQADEAYAEHGSIEVIEHKAYVAQRYADISKERIAEARAKQEIAQGEAERAQVLLQSRTREAEQSARRAQEAGREADAASLAAQERNRQLEQELADLKAKETERGLVLTLGDVLFDTAQNSLKPGAAGTLEQLAEFMRKYPDRHVMIEGHTDARGTDEYNLQLSERRAGSVRDALVARGIDGTRIRAIGLGESYPVASNDSEAGMQANRRVEIVISDETGTFPGASERAVAHNL